LFFGKVSGNISACRSRLVRAVSEEKKRFYFIDQFRGWAVLFMVETHVLNSFLNENLRPTFAYKALDFVNGLVAPAFLFIAGFSFAIVAMRRWDEYLRLGPSFWKQCGRCLQILLVGYLLHVPRFSLRRLFLTLHWNQRHNFWGVDVLQCIALSLLLLTVLVLVWRRPRFYFTFVAVVAVAVSLLTPRLFSLPLETVLPPALSGYLKRQPYSQFSLFPWLAFVWLGAFVSWLWQKARQAATEARFFRRLLAGGMALVAMFFIIIWKTQVPLTFGSFSPSRPLFFFLKLGLVLMLFSFLWRSGQKWGNRPALVTAVGQESLLAYAAHIAVIYGGFFGPFGHSLDFLIGRNCSWAQVALLTLGLVVATVALSLAWHELKKTRPVLARRVFWVGVLLLIAALAFRV
jgi:uncharacterized membrane protein